MIQKDYYYNDIVNLECGESLHGINIRYHVSDDERGDKPVLWICHALTANSNPREWWDVLVGPGLFFDTCKYYIVCANVLGSCYGTTGPSSSPQNPVSSPKNREQDSYKLSFPLITTRDFVTAHEILRRHLGIERIDLLVGGSNGGFQALEWAVIAPDVVSKLCLIATGSYATPWLSAINASQIMALEADITFGEQKSLDGGRRGLATARSIALISYRSYAGYNSTQAEEDKDAIITSKAASYQRYQGKKLADRFDAYSYYSLIKSTDTHNVGRSRGGVEKALKLVKAKTLCIAIDSDTLFPVVEMEALAKGIPGAELVVITSEFGHDGFLLEHSQIAKVIDYFFN